MSSNTSCLGLVRAMCAVGIVSVAALSGATAATLDRVRDSGQIRFGYFADAKPFTSGDAGNVEGYAARICQRIADHVKGELGLASLSVQWVQLDHDAALDAVTGGQVDALCTPTAVTIGRRKAVSYSIPVFPGGAHAVVRKDAAAALKSALAEAKPPKPVWRGSKIRLARASAPSRSSMRRGRARLPMPRTGARSSARVSGRWMAASSRSRICSICPAKPRPPDRSCGAMLHRPPRKHRRLHGCGRRVRSLSGRPT